MHVPFKGLPETHTAIIRGDVALGFSFFAAAGDLILSGKVRALAVTGPSRLKVLPDVPTFAEAGLPEYEYDSWFGILAPAGVPKAIVEKVSKDIADVLQQADVKARFEPQGVVLVSSQPAEFDRTIAERCGALRAAVQDQLSDRSVPGPCERRPRVALHACIAAQASLATPS